MTLSVPKVTEAESRSAINTFERSYNMAGTDHYLLQFDNGTEIYVVLHITNNNHICIIDQITSVTMVEGDLFVDQGIQYVDCVNGTVLELLDTVGVCSVAQPK